MTRQPVSSSAIKSIGHEGDVLEVEMQTGRVYRYHGVSAEAHAALMAAPSVGTHFGKHIRGQFTHAAVEESAQ